MKNIVFIVFFAIATGAAPLEASTVVSPSDSNLSAPTGQASSKPGKKKKRAETPVTPGSQVILLKNKMKAEIRPDKSVWWFGVNYRKAIMADGVHELKDGQKITTKRGKIVGKMPRPMKPDAKYAAKK